MCAGNSKQINVANLDERCQFVLLMTHTCNYQYCLQIKSFIHEIKYLYHLLLNCDAM